MSTPSASGWRVVCLSIAPYAARAIGQDAATTFTLPAGKLVILRLTEMVDSDHNLPGFKFGFQVAEPVRVDGRILIPADSPREGVVLHSAVSGHHNRSGELDPGETCYFACGARGSVFTKYCAPSNRRAYESYYGR